MDTNPNAIVLNAITVEMIHDSVNYMNYSEEDITLTSEELDEIQEALQDAVLDVITEFINTHNY